MELGFVVDEKNEFAGGVAAAGATGGVAHGLKAPPAPWLGVVTDGEDCAFPKISEI